MDKADLIVELIKEVKENNIEDHKRFEDRLNKMEDKIDNKKMITAKQWAMLTTVVTGIVTCLVAVINKLL